VHDLRRTSRTLLAKFGVIDDVAELSLGHAIKGTKGIYNVCKSWFFFVHQRLPAQTKTRFRAASLDLHSFLRP
jgi:hypothetical protein